jgi:hypothetical protein
VDGFFGNVALTADLNGDRLDDLIVQDEGAGTFHVFFAIPQDAVLR